MNVKNSKLSRKEAMLLLNSLPKLGPISTNRLLDFFERDPLKIFHASQRELLSISGVGPAMVNSILDQDHGTWVQNELEIIQKHSTSFITEEEIPSSLREIYDTPMGLYVKGTIPPGPYFAIVGTRLPSLYAQKVCSKISTDLALAGFCVVSGMARGIDSIAHQSALDVKGKTIAFLGSGMDIVYPPENLGLYQRIASEGAVITEFPFKRKADRRTFPMRNRLVSGISSGLLVVESGSSGGSLITARFAAEQGRTVFAIPGRVDQPCSQGCHQLIREGAILITNANEIIEDLKPSLTQTILPLSESRQAENPKNKINSDPIISKNEKIILNLLELDGAMAVEQMCSICELTIQEISVSLSLLELSNRVGKRHDGKYELN